MKQDKEFSERLLRDLKTPLKTTISREKGEERAKRLMEKFLKKLADPDSRYEAHTFLNSKILFAATRDTKAFYRYLAYFLLDFVSKMQVRLYQEDLQSCIYLCSKFLEIDPIVS